MITVSILTLAITDFVNITDGGKPAPNSVCIYSVIMLIVNDISVDIWLTIRAQWLRGRASDSRLREPGFESWLRR